MGFGQRLQSVFKRPTIDAVLMLSLLLLALGGLFAVARSLPGGMVRALGILWCLSCLIVGILAGFLFAIPRVSHSLRLDEKTNKKGQETQESSGKTRESREPVGLGINTNLEEISDWLTKILVGIGLVEAKTLKQYLGSAGRYIGGSLGPNGNVIAVGLVIFFLCIGFLSGFLATRLFISPSLRRADAETGGMIEAERVAQEAKDKSDATPELYDVLDAAYSTLKDFSERRRSAEFAAKVKAIEKAAERTPTDQRALDKAEVDQKPDAAKPVLPPQLAYSYLQEFNKYYDQPRWRLNRRLHMLMANFYSDTGDNSGALRVISRFIESKRQAEEFDIHLAAGLFNRACYHGRIALLTTDPVEREKQMVALLSDLREDIKICPSDAEEARQDDDLAPWIEKDPRVAQLLKP